MPCIYNKPNYLTAPFSGGTLRVIADVTDQDVIQTILKQPAPPVNMLLRTLLGTAQRERFPAAWQLIPEGALLKTR